MSSEEIGPLNEYQIAAQTGAAFRVKKGQTIRVVDVEGEQVADLVCFARQDPSDARPTWWKSKSLLRNPKRIRTLRSNRDPRFG